MLGWSRTLGLTLPLLFACLLSSPALAVCVGSQTSHVRLCTVNRLASNPLITPATSSTISKNIMGPTVIKVPNWLPNKLGAYYMYFAAHDGHFIRLAYANSPVGPWTVYTPGTLKDTQVAPFSDTISSPDVYIDEQRKMIRLYFSCDKYPGSTEQWSGVSESSDGLNFRLMSTQNIAKYYLRTFQWDGVFYGMQKGWSVAAAELGVSSDGVAAFNFIKTMSQGSVRHMGILLKNNILFVVFSRIGDAPERIYLSTIDLNTPPSTWDLRNPIEVIRPITSYEGAGFPNVASVKGPATNVNQLRDPFLFEDAGKTYLYYSIAGESGIAAAEITYELLTTPPPTPTPAPAAIAVGSRVRVLSNAKVYLKKPGSESFGVQTAGTLGLVTSGPTVWGGQTWWNVNFDSGVDGWTAAGELKKQ